MTKSQSAFLTRGWANRVRYSCEDNDDDNDNDDDDDDGGDGDGDDDDDDETLE